MLIILLSPSKIHSCKHFIKILINKITELLPQRKVHNKPRRRGENYFSLIGCGKATMSLREKSVNVSTVCQLDTRSGEADKRYH